MSNALKSSNFILIVIVINAVKITRLPCNIQATFLMDPINASRVSLIPEGVTASEKGPFLF